MRQIKIISKREFHIFFNSLVAYILLSLFLGLSGFFTWLYGSDVFFTGQATMQPFFSIAYWTLFFFIPAITMKMFAEEKKTGTIELILTKPVSDWQFILGKFFACLLLIAVALALTLPYYISISLLGNVDHGAVISGYLGSLLMSMALIGIGLFASSVTNNQIVSFLISLFIGIFFLIIFQLLSENSLGIIGYYLSRFSIGTHYESISRGVIDSRDVIYFLLIAFAGLYLSYINLSKRNRVY
ncbi:MAG: ABC transporter permease [Ignavibacteriales bacterium CG_4_9_14_3_um_filter_34_10]|nr:MAG: ABC transporter permease [Ignavibacteriales bacterium CG_4_9_14_3_um_filter_34_10]